MAVGAGREAAEHSNRTDAQLVLEGEVVDDPIGLRVRAPLSDGPAFSSPARRPCCFLHGRPGGVLSMNSRPACPTTKLAMLGPLLVRHPGRRHSCRVMSTSTDPWPRSELPSQSVHLPVPLWSEWVQKKAVRVGAYVRVSTEEQSFDRQLRIVSDYATRQLDVELGDIEVYRDKATGTNTARRGYKGLMKAVEQGELEAVVVPSVSRLCRSLRDLERTVERIVEEHGVELHFVKEGLVVRQGSDDPFQKAMRQLIGVFAELEGDILRQRVREGLAARLDDPTYHHGPAPLGFAKDYGRLVEGEDYDRVVVVLDMVAKGELSKRRAARELGCSRATIGRALERADLYGL